MSFHETYTGGHTMYKLFYALIVGCVIWNLFVHVI